jgi:hypothetical protein
LLSKCSNPFCSDTFRHLHHGKVFVLESDPTVATHKSTQAEYFWLCDDCSTKMALRLGDDRTVMTVSLPQVVRGRA